MKPSPTWFDVCLVIVKSSGWWFQFFLAFSKCLNFIQSCKQIILSWTRLSNYHTFTILIKSWPSCKLLYFSFYVKVSVAHVILSKEDVKTIRSEWSIEDFWLWHLLSSVPFLKVSLDRKLLKIIQILFWCLNCFTLVCF